jgi:hypothetical protein
MKNFTYLPVIIATSFALLAPDLRAQTINNFAASGLGVSGGETSVTNNACSFYNGVVNINTSGVITGVIYRRNFAATATNSTSASLAITNSRIFGTIVLANTRTTDDSWGSDGQGTHTVVRDYSADFRVATTNTNFFVKGRATHSMVTAVDTNVWYDGVTMVTNKYTNSWKSVNLGGVSFNAGQTRGMFNAD